jgi:deoxycytidine triphosphate deaminase
MEHNMPTLAEKRRVEARHLKSLLSSEVDPHPAVHGVLLSDEIIYYADNHNLISPFNRDNLKPAGYELTIGDEYYKSGNFLDLDSEDDEKNKVTIPPFEVAVLKTAEILCIPRYMIARWNIRVRHAYSGLLWVGGPQVDPGYVGHLFCPIYNLSDKTVTLHVGESIALVDFVKTTPFVDTKSDLELKRYPHPPKRSFLEDYGIDDLRSALFTKAGEKLVEFEDQIKSLEARFIVFTQISFAIFALVIALVALVSRVNVESVSLSAAFFGAGTIAISLAAFMVAAFSYVRGRVGRMVYEQYGRMMGDRAQSARRYLRRSWWLGVSICLLFAMAGGWGLYLLMEPTFRDLRQRNVITKTDLNDFRRATLSEVRELSDRVERIEGRNVTVQDLEKLRQDLDQRILAITPKSP